VRGVWIAPDPFPQAAHRTRRADLSATGSPQRLPSGVPEHPRFGDRVTPEAVPRDRYRIDAEHCDPVHRDRSYTALGVVNLRRTSFHLQWCSVRSHRSTRHQASTRSSSRACGAPGCGSSDAVRPATIPATIPAISAGTFRCAFTPPSASKSACTRPGPPGRPLSQRHEDHK